MLGYICALIIATLVWKIRKNIKIKNFLLITLIFFLSSYLLIKLALSYPKDEVIIFRTILKYSIILYLVFFMNTLYTLMIRRVISFINQGQEKLNNLLLFYEKIYFGLYIIANILINYGVWLK